MDDDKLVNTISRIYAGVRAEGDYVDQNYYETRTRAALAIIRPAVIEECAKVAEERRPMVDIQGVFRLGFLQGGMEIANAIRALNKGGEK